MKKKGGKLKWIIIIIVAFVILGALFGGDDGDSSSADKSKSSTEAKKVEYTKVSAKELVKTLNSNAAKAAKQYKGEYLSITGTLGNIDSDLSYFDIEGEEFDFTSIQCYIQNENQENAILDMEKGDKITVKGKCTDVGEVMGYSIEVDKIIKK